MCKQALVVCLAFDLKHLTASESKQTVNVTRRKRERDKEREKKYILREKVFLTM